MKLKQDHNLTVVYTCSNLEDVIELADSIHILNQGQLAFSGTPREILARVHELTELDIALPEAAQIALALREVFPAIRTDIVNLAELEEEIVKVKNNLDTYPPDRVPGKAKTYD